jgi:cytochrome c oxidase subunit 4
MLEYLEDPAYVIGVPLLLLAGLGMVIALSLFVPERAPATAGGHVAHDEHPDASQYVIIAIILAAITLFEVALFYVELNDVFLVVLLIALSAAKFALVVGYFMHLKFDNKLFTVMFATGLVLAFACFTVVMATLGSNLI